MPRKPITIIWPRMEPRGESNRGTDVNQSRVEKRRISARLAEGEDGRNWGRRGYAKAAEPGPGARVHVERACASRCGARIFVQRMERSIKSAFGCVGVNAE